MKCQPIDCMVKSWLIFSLIHGLILIVNSFFVDKIIKHKIGLSLSVTIAAPSELIRKQVGSYTLNTRSHLYSFELLTQIFCKLLYRLKV